MAKSRARYGTRHLIWAGASLSLVALVSYFTIAARYPGLRDTAWANLALMAAGLGLSGWALARRRSLWSIGGVSLSAICALALAGYVFGLSNQLPGPSGAVTVGEEAPGFQLHDVGGRIVSLADFSGSTAVLVFYRGHW
jgi:hypothetical protein